MDVVVTPTGSSSTEWSLSDRLGRHLGTIHRRFEGLVVFEIEPEPSSALLGINRMHGSLDKAMTAIEKFMGGACELAGRR